MADEATQPKRQAIKQEVTRDSTGTITEPGSQATTTPTGVDLDYCNDVGGPEWQDHSLPRRRREEKVEAAKGAPGILYADFRRP